MSCRPGRSAVARVLGLAPLLLAAPGCFWFTTKHEADVLRADVQTLGKRVTSQEAAVAEKVTQLDESLDRATKFLARNSADLGAEVERLADEQATLLAQNETLRRELEAIRAALAQLREDGEARATRIEAIERQVAGKAPATQPAATDRNALFDGAYRKLEGGQHAEARKDFRLFVQRFGQDDRADNAQYWIGEAFFREKEYEKAIVELQKVIDQYPGGDAADDAFLRAGLAALEMKWCVDAGAYLGELVRRHPKSPLVKTAKTTLASIKKTARDPRKCQP